MELACGCFKAKPNPQEISNLEQEGEVGRLLPKPAETNSQLGALSKQDDFQYGWLVLSAAYLLPATLWVALEVIERYFIEGLDDPAEKWSFRLPFLGTSKLRVCCMGLHFICGSVLTLSGVWQVLPYSKRPELRWSHRLVGRIFVLCAVLTALGGFTFIVQQTMLAGGYPMTVSFCIYGLSVVVCAVLAYWKAIQKDLESHRRWGLRAFAMGIASFEYRVFLYAGIKFGFTVSTEQNCEPSADGSVPFFRDQYYNQFIAWFFFVGNWVFVEWYLRASNSKLQQAILWIFIVLATIMMILYTYWGIERLTASD